MNAVELALTIKGDIRMFDKLGDSAVTTLFSFNLLAQSTEKLTGSLLKTQAVVDSLESSVQQLGKTNFFSDGSTRQIADITKGITDLDDNMAKLGETIDSVQGKMGIEKPEAEKAPGAPVKKTRAEKNKAFMEAAEGLANPLGKIFDGVMGAINVALPTSKDKPEYDKALEKINEITGSIGQLQGIIGEKLIPVAITVMNYLVAGFELIKPALQTVVGWFGELYNWLESNKEIIEPIAAILGGFAIGIWAVVVAQSAWAAATTFLSTTMELLSAVIVNMPVFGWIIAIIGAVIAAVIYLRNNFEGFGLFFSNLWENVKASFSIFVSFVKQGFEWLWYSLQLGVLKLKEFGQYIEGIFSNIGKAIQAALNLDFAGAKDALTAEIKTSASGEIELLNKEHAANVKGYEKESADAYATIKAHPLEGIIKRKKEEAPLTASDTATGGTENKKMLAQPGTNFNNMSGGGHSSSSSDVKDGINAVSGGGVKNITITVGKMFEKVEFHIQNGTKQMAYELERIAEEAVTRAIASASSK